MANKRKARKYLAVLVSSRRVARTIICPNMSGISSCLLGLITVSCRLALFGQTDQLIAHSVEQRTAKQAKRQLGTSFRDLLLLCGI